MLWEVEKFAQVYKEVSDSTGNISALVYWNTVLAVVCMLHLTHLSWNRYSPSSKGVPVLHLPKGRSRNASSKSLYLGEWGPETLGSLTFPPPPPKDSWDDEYNNTGKMLAQSLGRKKGHCLCLPEVRSPIPTHALRRGTPQKSGQLSLMSLLLRVQEDTLHPNVT